MNSTSRNDGSVRKGRDGPALKLFLLAGEASGDRIGADLIARLKQRMQLDLCGVGGAEMAGQGLKSLFPITNLSVMGYVDVVRRLPLLLWRVRQTIRFILAQRPDIVVLIDSQVFSNLVARGLKKKGFSSPILLYVGPTVWGYKPERAERIKNLYAEILAILPFEPAVMERLNGPRCRYVGHPALAIRPRDTGGGARKTIVLMPGSRKGELKRHLPMFEKAATALSASDPGLKFIMPTLPHLVGELARKVSGWPLDVRLESNREKRDELLGQSRLAICVAGTATLELALANVPMVVCYVMDLGQRQVRKTIDLKHFSLPNLVLDEPLVPELLFEKPDPESITACARQLLEDEGARRRQQEGFARMRALMKAGTPAHPRRDPSDIILSHVPDFLDSSTR